MPLNYKHSSENKRYSVIIAVFFGMMPLTGVRR